MSVGAAAAPNVADERRSATAAGTASSAAAMLTRAITTASGVHPASSSAVANDPEVPNVAADSTANPTPVAALPGDLTSHSCNMRTRLILMTPADRLLGCAVRSQRGF